MSTVHHPLGESEEPELPPGFDPTRDVLRPARPPGARPPYQPLSGRAAAATAVFGLLLVLDIVAVGSSLLEVNLLDQLAAGESVSDAELDANDTRQAMIGLGQGALGVACAITFISWLHRAYSNMDAVSPPHRRFDTGWSIGAWFVPFLNLWRPKQIVDDVWNSGTPATSPPAWLMLWWIGWIISNVLGRIAFPSLDADASLAELRSDSVNYMIADGFDVAVLALAIVVIRVLTKRQVAKADARAAPAPEPAAPIASPQPA